MVRKSGKKKQAAKRKPTKPAALPAAAKKDPPEEAKAPEETDAEFDQGSESNRSPALQAGGLPSDLEGKRPDFEVSATLMEYHEIPPSDQQGGVRLKWVVQMPSLKVCEDHQIKKRLRYGMLRINYFPDDDHSAALDLRGKLDIVEQPPLKADKEGKRILNFWPGDPVTGDVSDTLLKLRRSGDRGTTVNIAFWGTYAQADMFGEKEAAANLDA